MDQKDIQTDRRKCGLDGKKDKQKDRQTEGQTDSRAFTTR
jgi:hypothetical protein